MLVVVGEGGGVGFGVGLGGVVGLGLLRGDEGGGVGFGDGEGGVGLGGGVGLVFFVTKGCWLSSAEAAAWGSVVVGATKVAAWDSATGKAAAWGSAVAWARSSGARRRRGARSCS